MATIKPFAALRPKPDLAERICQLPYDVMSSAEARALAAGNPLSFLRVSKPEIDLPPSTDVYAPEVYARGRENFSRLIADGALRQDSQPCFYFYRQSTGSHSQAGLVATASCEDYLRGVIKRHELTQPKTEDDRVRHIEALNAQTGPAFLIRRAAPALDEFEAAKTSGPPDVDFTAEDGVRHTSWTVSDRADIQFIQAQFERMPFLYIADGHHRSAAAARVCQKRRGVGNSAHFLSVIFSAGQVQILPYNRVLKDLNGLAPEALLKRLGEIFIIASDWNSRPNGKREVCFYLQGRWHTLRFRPHAAVAQHPIEDLDVALLQKNVLSPVFGIRNPRASRRISFVGGIRGTGELEKLVNNREYACAFSLFPTSVEELMTIADAGGVMPPKSTWFEPKLRDGMFCHVI